MKFEVTKTVGTADVFVGSVTFAIHASHSFGKLVPTTHDLNLFDK
jgi:hypothetical protein